MTQGHSDSVTSLCHWVQGSWPGGSVNGSTQSICCIWEQQVLMVALSLAHAGEHLEWNFIWQWWGREKEESEVGMPLHFLFHFGNHKFPMLLGTKAVFGLNRRSPGNKGWGRWFAKASSVCVPSMSLLPPPPEDSFFFVLSDSNSITSPSC